MCINTPNRTHLSPGAGSVCPAVFAKEKAAAVLPVVLAALVLTAAAGCTGGSSADEAVDRLFKESKTARPTVVPLTGRVLFDGQPARLDRSKALLVILNDATKPDLPVARRPRAHSDLNGNFAFSTFKRGDGAEPGRYVLTFTLLQMRGPTAFAGPDGLKNLFNDPERTGREAEFMIEHQAPGRTDYVFDLKLAGRDPVEKPGARALIGIE